MQAKQLSRELRHSSSSHLRRRRRIVGLSLAAMAPMALVSLYQMGLIKRLPDPPLALFNTEQVDGAQESYDRFSTPESVLAVASYGFTLRLAAMGGADRSRARPWLPLAMAAKVAFDGFMSLKRNVDHWTNHRKLCFWCLLSTVATLGMAPLVVPEMRAAWQSFTAKFALGS